MTEKELVIIGAGPAGLKAAEEAKRAGIDYTIVEKGLVGQAWRDIRPNMPMLSPCHPQRDWTSISDRFPIWKLDISRPFCNAEEFVRYLEHYTDFFNLNVLTHNAVEDIKQDKNGIFEVVTSKGLIQAKTVIVGTGFFGNPFIPDIQGFEGHPLVSHSHFYTTPQMYKKKRVVILGGGNSAVEIAIELTGFSQVFLLTRQPLRFFSKTKNLCDIRGVSESMLLELIRMGLIRHMQAIEVQKLQDNKLFFNGGCLIVDHIICATGYHPFLPVFNSLQPNISPRNKFPKVTAVNEAMNIRNLFFVGPLAYKRSGSMFIHGFVKQIPVTLIEVMKRIRNQ